MDQEINNVALQLFLLILKIAGPLAGLRLSIDGIKSIIGHNNAISEGLRQVGAGLFVIFTSQTIVWLITTFAKAVAVYKDGW